MPVLGYLLTNAWKISCRFTETLSESHLYGYIRSLKVFPVNEAYTAVSNKTIKSPSVVKVNCTACTWATRLSYSGMIRKALDSNASLALHARSWMCSSVCQINSSTSRSVLVQNGSRMTSERGLM